MGQPLVSICIPVYNGERYLAECLASALAQTYDNCEIIVSDDSSSDGSWAIAEEFAVRSRFPFRLFHHTPSGIGGNWNYCVAQAHGEYIKFLFQDDLLIPGCVDALVASAESDPEIGLVIGRREVLTEAAEWSPGALEKWLRVGGDPVSSWRPLLSVPRAGRELLADPKLLQQPRNKIGEPTAVLLRKSIMDVTGPFSETLKQMLDYEYWYRMMPYCKVSLVDETLASFRLHVRQATRQNADAGYVETDDFVLLHLCSLTDVRQCLHPRLVRQARIIRLRRQFRYRLWQLRSLFRTPISED